MNACKLKISAFLKRSFAAILVLLFSGCGGGGRSNEDFLNANLTFVSRINELALDAVRNSGSRPTVTTRQLFLLSTAMYDAWSIYDPIAVPVYFGSADKQLSEHNSSESKERAVAQAAYHMLIALFPAYSASTGNPERFMHEEGFSIVSSASDQSPESIGYLAAMRTLQARESDGSNAANNYADITSEQYPDLYSPANVALEGGERAPGGDLFNPNRWQPLRVPNGSLLDENGHAIYDNDDSTSYQDQKFLTPHFGNVEPFALHSANQFRPVRPPQKGSSERYVDGLGAVTTSDQAWNDQFDEILAISAGLTDRQKVIAEFWADGPRSEAPPGHWNQLAHGICERDAHTIDQDIKLYFALNAALFDTAISIWEAKRYYDFIRPVSAIRHKYYDKVVSAWAGPDLGTREILGQHWRPYQNVSFVTPPFAEYVSGHSGFSHAAAEVLTRFTGSNAFYNGEFRTAQDVNSDGEPDFLGEFIAKAGTSAFETNTPQEDVVLHWPTFQDAAAEAAVSRRYGGIHIQDGDLRARDMGTAIGAQAYAKAESYWLGTIQR